MKSQALGGSWSIADRNRGLMVMEPYRTGRARQGAGLGWGLATLRAGKSAAPLEVQGAGSGRDRQWGWGSGCWKEGWGLSYRGAARSAWQLEVQGPAVTDWSLPGLMRVVWA